jgi:dTDP-D-glucose 4,6-dehydratase
MFSKADFIDNDEAEAAALEELRRASVWEAAEVKQREEEDVRWAIYEVRVYEELQWEATVRRVELE